MTTLRDVLQELVTAVERPDGATLEEIVRRYPQFATELTDFAVEWVLQDSLPEEEASEDAESAVPEAMRRFRAKLRELDGADSVPAVDPFAERPAAELARIATVLALDKTILAKLRDRKILGDTVPGALREGLARELAVPVQVVASHLAAPAAVHAGASFKAAVKPRPGPKETFEEAVRRSTLTAEGQAMWLADAGSDQPPPAD